MRRPDLRRGIRRGHAANVGAAFLATLSVVGIPPYWQITVSVMAGGLWLVAGIEAWIVDEEEGGED